MNSGNSYDPIEYLKTQPTPSVANALEVMGYPRETIPCMSPDVRCVFPDFRPMAGYAATATVAAEEHARDLGHKVPSGHWEAVLKVPAPRVIVVQDLDQPAAQGSWWGEVNGNIHKALGAVGVVTNGSVRDLDEVHALGFHFFAAAVTVSHRHCHLIDFGLPIKVGGIKVCPGDVIHGDKHGVLVVPREALEGLPAAVDKVTVSERRIIDLCQSPEFSVERLRALFARHVGKGEYGGDEK